MNIKSRWPKQFGDEARVRQVIGLDYSGRNYLLWYAMPGGINPREALSQRLANMRCELLIPEIEHVFESAEHGYSGHGAFSICRWELTCSYGECN